MKKSPLAAALASVLALSLGMPAFAQDGSDKVPQADQESFVALDRNLDGEISLDEAKQDPDLFKHFTEADTNNNDEIDLSEFSAFEAKENARHEGENGAQPPSAGGQGEAQPQGTPQ